MELTAQDWDRAHAIARDLAVDVDRNELGKAVTFFRLHRDKEKFLTLILRKNLGFQFCAVSYNLKVVVSSPYQQQIREGNHGTTIHFGSDGAQHMFWPLGRSRILHAGARPMGTYLAPGAFRQADPLSEPGERYIRPMGRHPGWL